MDGEIESTDYCSDEEISFISKSIVKKCLSALSSDEDGFEEDKKSSNGSRASRDPSPIPELSEVQEDITTDHISKQRKFSRVKLNDSSDSDSSKDDGNKTDTELSSKVNENGDDFKSSTESFTFPKMGSEDVVPQRDDEKPITGAKFQDDIYDAEGSSDEDLKENSYPDFSKENEDLSSSTKKKSKSTNSKRNGTKKANNPLSELDEIHKETQRMVRESRVSLPYHIPKQRSLQDFLARRKAVPIIPLKSTSENLSLVWKHIEEREKIAESFYNSESEDEEPTKSKPIADKPAAVTANLTENNTDNVEYPTDITENNTDNIENSTDITETTSQSNPNETIDSELKDRLTESSCDLINRDGPSENDRNTNDSVANLNIDENAVSSCLFEDKLFSNKNSDEIQMTADECLKNNDSKMNETDKINSDKDNKILPSDVLKDLQLSDSSSNMFINDSNNYLNKPDILNNTDGIQSSSKSEEKLKESLNVSADEFYSGENLAKSLLESLDKKDELDTTVVENESALEKSTLSKAAQFSLLNDWGNDLLEKVPKLSCGPGDEIDLDQPIGGANKLLKRFLKHAKLKTALPKEQKSVKFSLMRVESNAGEVVSMTEEELTVTREESKPGQGLSALKESLKKSIDKSRSQLMAKKIKQYKLYEKEFDDEDGDYKKKSDDEDGLLDDKSNKDSDEEMCNNSDKEVITDEEDIIGAGDSDDEIDDNEDLDDRSKNTKKRRKSDFLDEEAEVTDDEDFDDEDDESQDILTKVSEKGVKKSLDFDDCGSPVKQLDLSGLGLDKGFEEDNDLIGLCSGKFQTQPVSLTQLEEDDSSQSCSDYNEKNLNAEDNFSQEIFSQKSAKIIDSDEEDLLDKTQSKHSKSTTRLQFSDDEDSETDNKPDIAEDEGNISDDDDELKEKDDEIEDDGENQLDDENSEDGGEDKIDQTSESKVVHYDSEEEIIEGHKFLDVEAELSGSEWGSADENEKGLSDFEADEADMEKINQRKLKSELERIHVQELMAEDKREIRLLQELLLEDGDLHSDGPKRQRLYRWSNQEDLDNGLGKVALSDEEGAIGDDEEEEDNSWRKQRQEREEFLNSINKEEDVENGLLGDSTIIPICEKKLLKHQPIAKVETNLTTSPDVKQPFKLLTTRGSFLGRSERVLTRLASLATSSDQQRVKRNMVFSVVSPPKVQDEEVSHVESEKRKAVESLPRVTKKLKFNEKSSKGLRSLGVLQKLKEIDQAT